MLDYFKLPLAFDATKMQEEVIRFNEDDWIPHFNQPYYKGDWSAIPLRSIDGNERSIFPDPTGLKEYADTIHIHNNPYLKEVVNSFKCDKIDVRLLRLKAGSVIKEHRDFGLGFEDGEVRIHIPITTNPELEFYLNGVRVVMNVGECWFLNFNYKHSVNNFGKTDRIHLVIDCKVNKWLSTYFNKVIT